MTAITLPTSLRSTEPDSASKTMPRRPSDDWVLADEEWTLPQISDFHSESSGTIPQMAALDRSVTSEPPSREFTPPIRRDRVAPTGKQVKLLQQWECVVVSVQRDLVECEMHDLTDESRPPEWAEIFLDEFSRFDRPLLEEGAVFYWSVGHETSRTGQVRRYSELRVRRIPQLSKLKKREIALEAKQLSELFNGDS